MRDTKDSQFLSDTSNRESLANHLELAAAEDVIFEYGFKFGWRNRRDPRSLSNNTLLDALGYAILIGDAEGSTCLMKIALQRRGIIEAR